MYNQLQATVIIKCCIPLVNTVFNKSSTGRNSYRGQDSSTVEESAMDFSHCRMDLSTDNVLVSSKSEWSRSDFYPITSGRVDR